ncbi:hypothetical protein C1922_12795 [Stenotrophomonas sp. ZAC14D2_NAIMI4_7]|uniref:hypothetical protein n=1 Tax=Stenotrophomonas sp. ZAC14D2_NAIMI4_7 TaxID=2072405 RepID=UPI000D5405C8|nr:hypothetical protein [Stenotrophomonas sp. ZAC14D2_NAIMI4_7]AWH18116.1 hypothetical protein C1922_12795 [Stenotrophomonas sp. ZAC14D2_NAIMI4_7]
MTGITPDQARANADLAGRTTDEFIQDIDHSIDANSRKGERRIVVALPRGQAREGQAEAVLAHYQDRGYVVEQLSVTGHAWHLQIGW